MLGTIYEENNIAFMCRFRYGTSKIGGLNDKEIHI